MKAVNLDQVVLITLWDPEKVRGKFGITFRTTPRHTPELGTFQDHVTFEFETAEQARTYYDWVIRTDHRFVTKDMAPSF